MDFTALLLTFTTCWKMSWSLHCYRCEPKHTPAALPCASFNNSAEYLIECPVSTMCYKRFTVMDYGNGIITQDVQRNCASQTSANDQQKINRKWQRVTIIREIYEEKCFEDPTDSERLTRTIHCYCRGDKCNHAEKQQKALVGLLVVGFTLLIAI